LCGLLEEGAHEKSPKCLGGNLGDFGGILQRSQITGYLVAAGKAKRGHQRLAACRAGKPSEQKFGLRSGR